MEQFVCLSHAGGLYFCDVICAQRYSLKLVEEVTLQILFLDTKPFVISTDELFQVDAYF